MSFFPLRGVGFASEKLPALLIGVDGTKEAEAFPHFWKHRMVEEHGVMVDGSGADAQREYVLEIVKAVLEEFGDWAFEEMFDPAKSTNFLFITHPITFGEILIRDEGDDDCVVAGRSEADGGHLLSCRLDINGQNMVFCLGIGGNLFERWIIQHRALWATNFREGHFPFGLHEVLKDNWPGLPTPEDVGWVECWEDFDAVCCSDGAADGSDFGGLEKCPASDVAKSEDEIGLHGSKLCLQALHFGEIFW